MKPLQKSKQKGFLPRKKRPIQTLNSCMLCLELINSKQRYTYTTTGCKCAPTLHDKCFEQWNSTHPGSCAACRKSGTTIVNPTPVNQVAAVGGSEDSCCISCIFGCWGCMTFLDAFTS